MNPANVTGKIKAKIEHIEKLLAEVKSGLETLDIVSVTQTKRVRATEPIPPEEQFQMEYQNLYDNFIATNSAMAVEEFVKSKKKTYLKAFCQANSLPVNVNKTSKSEITNVIIQWFAQRKVITKKAT